MPPQLSFMVPENKVAKETVIKKLLVIKFFQQSLNNRTCNIFCWELSNPFNLIILLNWNNPNSNNNLAINSSAKDEETTATPSKSSIIICGFVWRILNISFLTLIADSLVPVPSACSLTLYTISPFSSSRFSILKFTILYH